MKTIYLKDFIKTGKFGEIEIGVSTKDDVVSLMGESYDFGDFGETQIIKYGWYEFFYWTESKIIHAIQNDHLQYYPDDFEVVNYKNEKVKIDTWFLKANRNINFSEIINILNKEGIKYSLEKHKFEDTLEFIRLKNGITIDFQNEETIWNFNKSTNEWEGTEKIIENQNDYIINGIRLFDY